jgi:hypothetical protein
LAKHLPPVFTLAPMIQERILARPVSNKREPCFRSSSPLRLCAGMRSRVRLGITAAILINLAFPGAFRAADVEGTIVIKRKLTKRRVTSPAGGYARGVNVQLGAGDQEDSLAFERSRVVVYLEGVLPSTF